MSNQKDLLSREPGVYKTENGIMWVFPPTEYEMSQRTYQWSLELLITSSSIVLGIINQDVLGCSDC